VQRTAAVSPNRPILLQSHFYRKGRLCPNSCVQTRLRFHLKLCYETLAPVNWERSI
jgi:hypothetical protein